MYTIDISGKTILISGGCGAIGRVVVRVLADAGASVAVNDIVSEPDAGALLREAGVDSPRVAYFREDAATAEGVNSLFERVRGTLGQPDVVCCHAGMVAAFPVQDYPLDKFDNLLALNVRSSFLLAQTAARHWLSLGASGHLIFTTSWVQDVPWPEITPYTASKAALKAMMRGFARELAPHGIRANAVAPGIVAIGLAKRQWDTDPSYRARAEKAIPLGSMQPPETVGHAFLFLCSELAAYMTGAVMLVDGGCSLYPMD